MLLLRYPAVDMFKPLSLFSEIYVDIADFAMDPLLAAMDQVLDDERLLLLAWNDWATRRPHCLQTGRPSTPVEALLRLQVVRRWYGWAYGTVHDHVKGSLALRQFTRLYGHTVPNHATIPNDPKKSGSGPTSHPPAEAIWRVGRPSPGRELGPLPAAGGAGD